MEKKNPRKILVVQTCAGGISDCCREINRHSRLLPDVDFLTFTNTGSLQELLFIEVPQLLIIDMLSKEVRYVVDIVRELRQRNPELVVVLLEMLFFGTHSKQHMAFDREINRTIEDWGKKLVDAIEDFQSGKMRRTPVAV